MARKTKAMARRARGVIVEGRSGCIHIETVAYDNDTDHLLGRCHKCPLVRDYTILQYGANILSGRMRAIYRSKNHKGGKCAHGLIDEEAEADAVFSY